MIPIKELEKYEETIQDEIRNHVRILLCYQHIFERKDKSIYRFITNPDYFNVIKKILDASGYEVVSVNTMVDNGLIGIIPISRDTLKLPRRMRGELVKVIICLHKIYSEQALKGNIDEYSRVPSNMDSVANILDILGRSNGKSLISLLRETEDMKIIEEWQRSSDNPLDNGYKFMINESVFLYVTQDFIENLEKAIFENQQNNVDDGED